jgi:alanine racemase
MYQNMYDTRTWIEIHNDALIRNCEAVRAFLPPHVKLMSVVKSNAYGHDFLHVARIIQGSVDAFGVDDIDEALALRMYAHVQKPILCLGYTLTTRLVEAAEQDVSVMLSSLDTAGVLRHMSFAKPLRVHIAVDTGLHRQGFSWDQREKLLALLIELGQKIQIEGLYTHFAIAEEPGHPYNDQQLALFMKWKDFFKSHGFTPLSHTASTAALLAHTEARFDMVRMGIGTYGLWPSTQVQALVGGQVPLEPVLSWKALVSEVKVLKKGDYIGYDLTEQMPHDGKTAVIPVGYSDGLPRSLSSQGEVLIGGFRAKIMGRISMDVTVVDVSHIPDVKQNDVVTFIGRSRGDEITVEEFARKAGTINYEAVTRINPWIRRVGK